MASLLFAVLLVLPAVHGHDHHKSSKDTILSKVFMDKLNTFKMLQLKLKKIKEQEESIFPEQDKRDGDIEEKDKLETSLVRSWRELDRMLYCTKIARCVMRYQKKVKTGNKVNKVNLIQSISITLHRIKQLTAKLKEMKR